MYVPLSHAPGHAQCDFRQAKAVNGGVERTVHYFVLDLPHNDACFVKAYPAQTTEAFCDGHVSAFSFLGGVPRRIVYDNTRLAVARILGDGRHQRTRVYSEAEFRHSLPQPHLQEAKCGTNASLLFTLRPASASDSSPSGNQRPGSAHPAIPKSARVPLESAITKVPHSFSIP